MAAKNILNGIPYNYVIGGKSSPSPIPFYVKVSFDPDAKKTILKTAGLVALGLGFGTMAGILISNTRKRRRNGGR